MQETQEMQVGSLGWENPVEEEMATHCSILIWEILWREEPGRLQSMGSQSQTWLSIHAYTPNSLNWFRILDLWVLAENQKMSGSGSDMRPVSLLLCTCERAGLHQCFPGCRMRQVNEMFLDGLASSWKNVDSQSRHAPRLGFQNIGCFIFVVIIYVSDIC